MTKSKIAFTLNTVAYGCILFITTAIPFSKSLVEIGVVVGLISFYLSAFLGYPIRIKDIPLAVPLLCYLIAAQLSMINNLDFHTTSWGLLRILKYMGLYTLVVNSIRSERRFNQWMFILFWTVCFGALNGIIQKVSGWDIRGHFNPLLIDGIERVRGSFNHPNNFAAFLTTSIIIFLYTQPKSLWHSLGKWFLLFLCFAALGLTYSRTPVLLMLATLLIGGSIEDRFRKFSIQLFLLILALCGFYCLFFPDYLRHLIKIIFGDLRMEYWSYSLDLFRRNIFFGSGANTFMDRLGELPEMVKFGHTRFVYAHNFVLQMLVEIGLVGLSSFLFLLTVFFRDAFRFLKQTQRSAGTLFGILMGLIFFLLHSLVDNNLQSLQLLTFFWILIGVTMGMSIEKRPKAFTGS